MSEQVEKGLVPELRFPEFLGSPAWSQHIAGDHLKESRIKGSKGDTAKKITVKLWGKGVYEKSNERKGSVNTQYYRRSAGQFIYSKLDFLNQAFGIVPQHLDNYESTVDLPCFDLDQGIDSVFLLEYVQQKSFYERLGETADGSRKARRIHADTFLSFPIVMPTIEEQQKIARCLSSLDDLIVEYTNKLHLLETYKKGLMQQLFPVDGETVPKMRFPDFHDEGDWVEGVLRDHIQLISGMHLSPKEYAAVGAVPYFTGPSDFTNSDSDISKWTDKQSNYAVGNDVLITVKGSGIGELWHLLLPVVAMGRQIMAVRGVGCSSQFMYHFLATKRQRFEALGSGNLIPGLSRGDILDMTIWLPSIEEQQKIADCLSSIDDLITAQVQKIEALKAHKKGLIQQLFPATDEVNA